MTPTTVDTVDARLHTDAIAELQQGAQKLVTLGTQQRQQVLLDCIAGVEACWEEWVQAAWKAKRISPAEAACAEDIMTGPLPTLRYLRLLHQTLADIERDGHPQLPGKPYLERGHVRVPVFPTRSLFDKLLFGPIKAEVRMPEGTSVDNVFGDGPKLATGRAEHSPTVALVLGAGNISSIPVTDAFTKIFQDNQAVLLKMNPVNQYVGPIFERAFASLIAANVLRIVYGGAAEGAAMIADDGVDCVHITGSDRTHDAIVWGQTETDQAQRKAANTPVLNKPITSELGNVSPWIIVPGVYSNRQLRFQAENIVASVASNASFNCIATKMVITHDGWPQRDLFLDMIDEIAAKIPRRFAYYPGAADRYGQFAGPDVEALAGRAAEFLPWRFRRGVDIATDPHLFKDESFCCVCGETSIAADSASDFLDAAVNFANDQMWGTLSAALTVPQQFQKQCATQLDQAMDKLRYGIVGINQWPGVAFALMSTPWGAFPGSTLADIQSGAGSVHNTYLLDRPMQTVISSPLTMLPKPMWFSTHRCPEAVARKLIDVYLHPKLWRLPSLLVSAMRG